MPSTILELILRAKDEATARVKGLFGSFTELSSALGLAKQGFQAAGQVIDETVGKFVEYNKRIREMKQVTGLTAEETSRLVQVSDDWGIEIGTIQTALASMAKKGFKPSIDNLAELADQYVAASDKTRFLEEASKKLGRQVTTLVPLFAKGGAELKRQTAAINDNLVATDKSIAQAREHEVLLDEINDSMSGLEMTAGRLALPEIDKWLQGISAAMSDPGVEKTLDFVFRLNELAIKLQRGPFAQLPDKIVSIADAAAAADGVLPDMAEGLRNSGIAASEASPGLSEAAIAANKLAEYSGEASGKLDLVTASLSEISSQQLASEAIDALNDAYQTGKIDEAEYRTLLAEIGTKLSGLPAEQVIASMALFDLKQSLDDGTLSAGDFIIELEHLDDWMHNIDRDIDINIRYHITTSGSPPAGGGGPPGTGQTPEFAPEGEGSSIPKGANFGRVSAGQPIINVGDVYIVTQPGMNAADVYQIALRAFADAVNKSGGSKSSVFVE